MRVKIIDFLYFCFSKTMIDNNLKKVLSQSIFQ